LKKFRQKIGKKFAKNFLKNKIEKMEIREISGKILQQFFDNFRGEKTFLQSEKFGIFREKCGEKILKFGIFENKKIVGAAQIQKIETRFKKFLHVPHGPLISAENWEIATEKFLDFLVNFGREKNCDFVRISPLFSENKKKIFIKKKWRDAAVHLVNPEKTLVLNLEKSTDEILRQMRKSTRYEIRRAEKCGIEIARGRDKKNLEIFWELHRQTFLRQKFVPFPKKNTEIELEIFGENAEIFSAKIDGKFFSSAIILFDKNAGYYHQGASIYSKLPAAHAAIWAAILAAKSRGCREFNFWGICEKEKKNHPWAGLSKFKRGFGGTEKNFLHAQDFPLKKAKFAANFLLEKFRKWKRNY